MWPHHEGFSGSGDSPGSAGVVGHPSYNRDSQNSQTQWKCRVHLVCDLHSRLELAGELKNIYNPQTSQ